MEEKPEWSRAVSSRRHSVGLGSDVILAAFAPRPDRSSSVRTPSAAARSGAECARQGLQQVPGGAEFIIYKAPTLGVAGAVAAFPRGAGAEHMVQVSRRTATINRCPRVPIFPSRLLMADTVRRSTLTHICQQYSLFLRRRTAVVDAVDFLDAVLVDEERSRGYELTPARRDFVIERSASSPPLSAGSRPWQTSVQIENFGAWHEASIATGEQIAGPTSTNDQRSAACSVTSRTSPNRRRRRSSCMPHRG